LSRHRVKPNDVIFARRGDLSRAAAISEREIGWLCGTGCFLLRAPKGKLDANWLAMTYRFPSIQRQVMANAIGSTMPNLNGQVMKKLIFAFPSFEEQVAIVERLSAQSRIIFQNAERVKKLNTIKTGLMQDLLSSEVSITPLLEGLNPMNTNNQKQTKEEIDNVLSETQKENLLLIKGNGQNNIVIGVPHHAPLGVSNLPCKEHPDADENAGFLGAEVARLLDCNCIIACNARNDPNKKKETDYSQQIISWKPRLLIEIHGHGGKSAQFAIEISCGTIDRNNWSLDLEERLKQKKIAEPLLKDFTMSGDFKQINLKATKSYTITAREWVALHIELPKTLRQAPEIYLPFCKVLAESISELMEGEKQ